MPGVAHEQLVLGVRDGEAVDAERGNLAVVAVLAVEEPAARDGDLVVGRRSLGVSGSAAGRSPAERRRDGGPARRAALDETLAVALLGRRPLPTGVTVRVLRLELRAYPRAHRSGRAAASRGWDRRQAPPRAGSTRRRPRRGPQRPDRRGPRSTGGRWHRARPGRLLLGGGVLGALVPVASRSSSDPVLTAGSLPRAPRRGAAIARVVHLGDRDRTGAAPR